MSFSMQLESFGELEVSQSQSGELRNTKRNLCESSDEESSVTFLVVTVLSKFTALDFTIIQFVAANKTHPLYEINLTT